MQKIKDEVKEVAHGHMPGQQKDSAPTSTNAPLETEKGSDKPSSIGIDEVSPSMTTPKSGGVAPESDAASGSGNPGGAVGAAAGGGGLADMGTGVGNTQTGAGMAGM